MTSTALEGTPTPAELAAAAGRSAALPALGFRLYDSIEAAEPVWRRLEAEAILTPYQRFDWIAPLAAARAGGRMSQAVVVIELEAKPVALMPLEIGRKLGVRRATLFGADIGNADWLVVLPEAAPLLTRARLAPLLAAAGRAAGIDLISLFNQPATWGGLDNPLLAFVHQPAPDNLYRGALGPDGTFNRFDSKRLQNLLRRRRKLGEQGGGEVVLRAAATVDDIDRMHAAFLEQRAARFAQMGIANIFAEPDFVRFFREAALASLGQRRPAMIFHALHAGDAIVATAIGTFSGTHYSQYINATSSDPAIAKFRLIGLLMHALFVDVAERGGTTIDMGLGDFDYKTDWTAPETTYDGQVPLTLAGGVAGTAILAARRLKRSIKQHDRLWTLARKLRATLSPERRVG